MVSDVGIRGSRTSSLSWPECFEVNKGHLFLQTPALILNCSRLVNEHNPQEKGSCLTSEGASAA